MSILTSLPEEVLKLLMQHLPLKERLGSCCLVSRRLQAAAVAATDTLQLFKEDNWLTSKTPQCAESAQYWLSHYGQHLKTVHLGGFAMEPLLQLPCPNLRELQLGSGCSVQLAPSSFHPGVIDGCTNLTCLKLQCRLNDAPDGAIVDGLAGLVHLQHLDIQPRLQHWRRYSLGGLSRATLPCLQHLTHLRVYRLSIENLLQLSSLTSLQVLHMEVAVDDKVAVGPSSVPDLVLPASLKVLCLSSKIEAAILSLVPTGLQDLQLDCDVRGPTVGPDSFLTCMARLQQLTSFVTLPDGEAMYDGVDWPPAGPAYSALTASSSLVRMQLHDPPGGIWQHVFPATRTLPHLTSFVLTPPEEALAEPPFWNQGGFVGLVSCCPNLCRIDGICVQHGQHVSELHKLTALTHACFNYNEQMMFMIDESLSGLAQLTQLH